MLVKDDPAVGRIVWNRHVRRDEEVVFDAQLGQDSVHFALEAGAVDTRAERAERQRRFELWLCADLLQQVMVIDLEDLHARFPCLVVCFKGVLQRRREHGRNAREVAERAL